jgi:hypothetical protein
MSKGDYKHLYLIMVSMLGNYINVSGIQICVCLIILSYCLYK